jgi:hypothetical protein
VITIKIWSGSCCDGAVEEFVSHVGDGFSPLVNMIQQCNKDVTTLCALRSQSVVANLWAIVRKRLRFFVDRVSSFTTASKETNIGSNNEQISSNPCHITSLHFSMTPLKSIAPYYARLFTLSAL